MNQKQVGIFIAELRKEKRLTQAALGECLGVTNKTISRWENGNYMPDLSL
ncbi:MAG: helix-turn-helix transcriptional regulator [Bacillota bacterium]|nr:helix-turn-helix transcriptional regulator [Bacillota bacterium]